MGSFLLSIKSRLLGEVSIGSNVRLPLSSYLIGNVWVGKKTSISGGVIISAKKPGRVIIGEEVYIGPSVLITTNLSRIEIGERTMIGPRVMIFGHNHKYWSEKWREEYYSRGSITIGREVWIGAGAIILSGVKIGERSVIAAGAVVTKDVPSYSVAAGNPAKVVKKYSLKNELS